MQGTGSPFELLLPDARLDDRRLIAAVENLPRQAGVPGRGDSAVQCAHARRRSSPPSAASMPMATWSSRYSMRPPPPRDGHRLSQYLHLVFQNGGWQGDERRLRSSTPVNSTNSGSGSNHNSRRILLAHARIDPRSRRCRLPRGDAGSSHPESRRGSGAHPRQRRESPGSQNPQRPRRSRPSSLSRHPGARSCRHRGRARTRRISISAWRCGVRTHGWGWRRSGVAG